MRPEPTPQSRRRRIGLRRDRYHGWTLSLDGCDHPMKRLRLMYDGTRRKHFNRRISLAVALFVVAGSDRATRYLVKRDWSPGKLGPPFDADWPVTS